jgi:MATE family multidrug resistance protein
MGTGPLLRLAGQDAHLSELAHRYVVLQIPSVFPFLGFIALRSYLQGREIVAPAMWVMLPVNLLNVLFNWLLVFGPGPFPEWGLEGAAVATCVSRSLMGVFLLAWVLRSKLYRNAWEPFRLRERARFVELKQPLLLGVPIALQMGFEVFAFVLAAMVAGWFGAASLAGHSIVLSFAGLLFMIPLGVSFGTTTRVGNLVGAGRSEQLSMTMRATLVMTSGVIGFNVVTLLVGRSAIATAYTEDILVQGTAASTFLVAAAFQASDCMQVVAGGALRGMGRTRAPAVAAFVGYYAFGIPVGYYLGAVRGQGLSGLWWGLALGLTMVAFGLVSWLVLVLRNLAATLETTAAVGKVARASEAFLS